MDTSFWTITELIKSLKKKKKKFVPIILTVETEYTNMT